MLFLWMLLVLFVLTGSLAVAEIFLCSADYDLRWDDEFTPDTKDYPDDMPKNFALLFEFYGNADVLQQYIVDKSATFDLSGLSSDIKNDLQRAILVVPAYIRDEKKKTALSMNCIVNGQAVRLETKTRGYKSWPIANVSYVNLDITAQVKAGQGGSVKIDFPELDRNIFKTKKAAAFDSWPRAYGCFLVAFYTTPLNPLRRAFFKLDPPISQHHQDSPVLPGSQLGEMRVWVGGVADPIVTVPFVPEAYDLCRGVEQCTVVMEAPNVKSYGLDISYRERETWISPLELEARKVFLEHFFFPQNPPDTKRCEYNMRQSFGGLFDPCCPHLFFVTWKSENTKTSQPMIVLQSSSVVKRDISKENMPYCTVFVPGFCGSMSSKLFNKKGGPYTYSPLPGLSYHLTSKWELDPFTHSYDKIVDMLGSLNGGVECCGYDWRLNLPEVTSSYLIPAIDRAMEKTDLPKVQIVAHSMGNLVVAGYLTSHHYRGDVVRWFALAPPFRGSGNAYDMWTGANFNGYTLIGKLSYEILLNDIYIANRDGALLPMKTKEDLVAFVRYQIPSLRSLLPMGDGFEIWEKSRGKIGGRLRHLSSSLWLLDKEEWEIINQRLKGNFEIFLGTNIKTISGVYLKDPMGGFNKPYMEDGEYKLLFSNKGDGTVLQSSADPKVGGKVTILYNVGHSKIPDALSSKKEIFSSKPKAAAWGKTSKY